jgi:DNA polymerase-3 subunit delta
MHATAYLKNPQKSPTGPLVAVYGAERFLKLKAMKAVCETVLGTGDEELGLTKFPGPTIEFSTVIDELRTVSMFGDKRVVIIDDADDFIKEHRAALEKYLEKPAKKGVLLLDAKTWPATTRLAKRVAEIGLPLDCSALKEAELMKWLGEYAQSAYGKQITRDAAQTLIELRGLELGHLDQELAKLSSYVGTAARIDVTAVTKLVGGWKAETTWSMLDAVVDGHLDVALHLLDKLLLAGEHPVRLLGSITWTFRPIARATEAARQGQSLNDALIEAGVKPFKLNATQSYLKRIGRPRAERIYHWLLTADRELKGASYLPERTIVERLLFLLSGKS